MPGPGGGGVWSQAGGLVLGGLVLGVPGGDPPMATAAGGTVWVLFLFFWELWLYNVRCNYFLV